jgi:electron transfer flavoprotein alpha subunit
MAQIIDANGHNYALFGGGLLGFEIGAGLAARKNAGVTMEVTAINVEGGEAKAERPILQDSQISISTYRGGLGIIIGRINAFEVKETGGTATVEPLAVEFSPWSTKATMVPRGEQRGADINI